MVCHMARHITIPTSRRNSATLNKESDEEIRSHAIGDNYLEEEIKTVSPQPNRDFRSPLENQSRYKIDWAGTL